MPQHDSRQLPSVLFFYFYFGPNDTLCNITEKLTFQEAEFGFSALLLII